jgi:hypothetical protein
MTFPANELIRCFRRHSIDKGEVARVDVEGRRGAASALVEQATEQLRR